MVILEEGSHGQGIDHVSLHGVQAAELYINKEQKVEYRAY
jgi:hypothetical protein